MKPRTEELLYFLLWTTEMLTRPTFRNVSESYEAWAYRNGLLRQVTDLAGAGLLERATDRNDRLFRLTEAGRLHALGGRDPAIQWTRVWDRRWRLVLFDVPREQNKRRDQLRRVLRSNYLGLLQGSVWISPDPLVAMREEMENGAIDVNSLLLFEGMPFAGESNAQIVAGAWNFQEINRRYDEHMSVLDEKPDSTVRNSEAARKLQRWATAERQAWLCAVSIDPLLPEALLPADYLGRKAWRKRVQTLADAGEQIRNFKF